MTKLYIFKKISCRGEVVKEELSISYDDVVEINEKYGDVLSKFKDEDIDDVVCKIESEYDNVGEILDLALSYDDNGGLDNVINKIEQGLSGGVDNEEILIGYGLTKEDAIIGYSTIGVE